MVRQGQLDLQETYPGCAARTVREVERMHLKPLPAWIPEVYRLHPRTVDVEGYVSVNSIRYSVSGLLDRTGGWRFARREA